MDIKDIIAKNLIELRKNMGMTQLELAEKLNYSDKAVSKWERAESIPDVETLKNIADLYGVTVDFLLHEHSEADVKKKVHKKGLIAGQKTLIAILSVLLVWIIATASYVISVWCGVKPVDAAKCFIFAMPVSFIVLIVFDSIWGKIWLNMLFVSGLLWTVAVCVYSLMTISLKWLCFIAPIPLQIAVFVWYGLKILNHKIKTKNQTK